MFSSLNLGKFFGIDVYIHPTFWILPLFVLLQGGHLAGIAFNILFIFAVFACVVLHEIGHALAARKYGIGTRHITLYPIGGVAALDRMPEKPSREIAIALAGPAVNLVIAGTLFIGLLAGSSLISADYDVIARNPLARFVDYVFWANLVLFAFNLLPAFPMDGGRVLRALLAMRMTRLRATTVAVGVGTVVAIGIGIYGLLDEPMNLNLVVLAVAVYLLGQAELGMVRLRETGRVIRERAEAYFYPPEDYSAPSPHGPPSPGFSGLAWDATRGVWVEWKNGVAVGAIPSGR
ncbi:MAG TPA: site-2 protease family protein [Gemmata sp.]|jgi:Zn-dependent protease|nr:site-2 protease family protein [Gemmata sp.]